jgi:hypothetical protein
MSLQTRIQDLATRIGTEFNTVRAEKADAVHTHTASQITDFDAEVANNSAVAANTAKVSADGSIGTHSDVDLTGIVDGNLLAWNNAAGRFEPSTPGGGGDLLASNNLSDLASIPTARTNLGVDSSAEVDAKVAAVTLASLGGLTQAEVDARANIAVATVVDGAPAALDTLNEIAAALQDDANVVNDILAAQALRVRVDAAQTFSAGQLAQGQSNLNVVDAADIGNTDTNYVTTFESALS